jgi:hypothetical protein
MEPKANLMEPMNQQVLECDPMQPDYRTLALELAGTVPVPSPFPALGWIRVSLSEVPSDELNQLGDNGRAEQARKLLLEIVHPVHPRLTVTRVIKLTDLAAIFIPSDSKKPDIQDGEWLLPKDIESKLLGALKAAAEMKSHPLSIPLIRKPAVAFLPEAARVLLRAEVGMTAGESAEYPLLMPGERLRDIRAERACGSHSRP